VSQRNISTHQLDDILKGEVLTSLGSAGSALDVNRMLDAARRRFAPNAIWTIGALEVEQLTPEAHTRLIIAFNEFRTAGGIKLIVICTKVKVMSLFISAAREARNIDLKIVSSVAEASSLANSYRSHIRTKNHTEQAEK